MQSEQKRTNWDTVKSLTEHLWPKNHPDLKIRVVLAMFFLLTAKLINVYVPFLYKAAVDHLSMSVTLVLPVGIILSYGLARVMQ